MKFATEKCEFTWTIKIFPDEKFIIPFSWNDPKSLLLKSISMHCTLYAFNFWSFNNGDDLSCVTICKCYPVSKVQWNKQKTDFLETTKFWLKVKRCKQRCLLLLKCGAGSLFKLFKLTLNRTCKGEQSKDVPFKHIRTG